MTSERDDSDLGEPIAELARLTEEPTVGFLGRIRGAIERRRLGSQVTGLAWHGLILIALEFLSALFALTAPPREASRDEERKDSGTEPTA